MATDFDADISDAVDDLLTEAGESATYVRGAETTTMTLRKSTLIPQIMDTGNGSVIEVRPVDFIGKTIAFPYAQPLSGARIIYGGEAFEVVSPVSEKAYRIISGPMIRIHTQKVAN